VTSDHARKKAIRARMDATGEPYSTAARKIDAVGDPAAAAAVLIARVDSTLASPRARVGLRMDWGSGWGLVWPPGHRPGSVERLATFAARAVARRTGLASLRDKLTGALFHPAGEGFVEPAADRYQLDFRGHAVMQFDGQHYRGPAGAPLQGRHRDEEFPDAPLKLLRRLRGATDARDAGQETVRGTLCQVIAARLGPDECTVWVDDKHIRRVRTVQRGSSDRVDLSMTKTLELWDFGAEDVPADWTRLPSFPAGQQSPAR
jgi:hypothetical protein